MHHITQSYFFNSFVIRTPRFCLLPFVPFEQINQPFNVLRNLRSFTITQSTSNGETTHPINFLILMHRPHNLVRPVLSQKISSPSRRTQQQQRLHMCQTQNAVRLSSFGWWQELQRFQQFLLILLSPMRVNHNLTCNEWISPRDQTLPDLQGVTESQGGC